MNYIAYSANFDIAYPFDSEGTHSFLFYADKYFSEAGYKFIPLDECLKNGVVPAALICFNVPRKNDEQEINMLLAGWGDKIKCSAVFLMEPQTILGRNWKYSKHEQYDVIFTWRSDLVDDKKYFWLNYSQPLVADFSSVPFSDKKLCVMIAGNKSSYHPAELYSERVAAIRWFEKNQPDHFDLYGRGWDLHIIKYPKAIRSLRRYPVINRWLYKPFSSYRGEVKEKADVLHRYKFSICYENSREDFDYITEKIFDSFLSGCVPVYLGATNIEQRIPEGAFIDMRKFSGYSELFEYISTMGERSYLTYLDNIRNFLHGPEADPYRPENVAKILVDTMVGKMVADG